MSSHINPLPGEPHDVLAALRALADQPGNWPDTADRLIANLGQIPQSDLVFDPENETLLSLVLDDALKGVDISSRYPVFFQQLLNDQDLRQVAAGPLGHLETCLPGMPYHPGIKSLDIIGGHQRSGPMWNMPLPVPTISRRAFCESTGEVNFSGNLLVLPRSAAGPLWFATRSRRIPRPAGLQLSASGSPAR